MRTYKLVVLGSGGVGKSALTIQFVQNVFVTNYDPTIEDCYQKTMKDFILEIYDTAGIDQFAVSKDELIRSGDGFALVYSITSRTTCNDLEDMREQIIRIKNSSNVPMILVGNKCDLEDDRKVMTSYGSRLAQIYKCKFYETSAKDRTNVENMFYELSQLIIDKEKAEQEQEYLKKKSYYQSHSSLFKKKKKHCHFL